MKFKTMGCIMAIGLGLSYSVYAEVDTLRYQNTRGSVLKLHFNGDEKSNPSSFYS